MLVPIEPKTSIDAEELCLAPWLLPLIDAARKGDSIIEPLQCLVQSMGFGTFLYAVGTSKKLQHDERFYLWTTVPAEWIAEYDRNSYVEIDPRVRYGWSMWPPPLLWDQRIGNGNPRVKAFLDRAAVHGVGSGLAIYLRDGGNKIMFALNRPQRAMKDADRAHVASITSQAMYLGTVLHSVFMSNVIEKGIPPMQQGSPLSPRECQCLTLAAHGMTSIDIGLKLSITERTVNFHFSNIISKLGVLNRHEAIAMGVAHGLVRVEPRNTPLVPLNPSRVRDAQLKRWEALRAKGAS
jgi:LuxR family transcriptional regulator, quorum-sensing system regulator LasR